MTSKFAFLYFFFLAMPIRPIEPEVQDHVLVLTDDNFDEVVTKNVNILVKFYAPWCRHCRELAPVYSNAAEALKADRHLLAKIDVTVHTKTASRFSIKAYPTIILFSNGTNMQYYGGRTKSNIVSWMNRNVGPCSKNLANVEAVEAFKSIADVVVVLIGSEGYTKFCEYAKAHEVGDKLFGNCESKECLEHYEVENGTVVLFKKFDNLRDNMPKGYDKTSFISFVTKKSIPLIMKFDDKCSILIFKNEKPGLFFYYDQESEYASALETIINEVSLAFKDTIQVVTTGINHGLETRLAEYIGITEADLPTVRIHDTRANNLKKYTLEQEITVENISNFVNDWKNNKLPLIFKSEEIPTEQNEALYVLTGNSFSSVVLDPTKDVLVLFYVPWCGHCKRFALILEKLLVKFSGYKNLIFAKMNSYTNEVEKVSINKYPTLRLWPVGRKSSRIEYEDDDNIDGIFNFIKKNLSKSIPEKDDL